jgi:hypothetical protein
MTSFHVSLITAVQSEPFRKFDLRPATLLPQSAEPSPKPNANVFSHVCQAVMACYSWTRKRL